MKNNLFGISNIKSHTIKTHMKNIDLEINHFAIILYQREE